MGYQSPGPVPVMTGVLNELTPARGTAAGADDGRSPGRVVVCDDRAELRAAITVALRGHPSLRVVGEALDGPTCLEQVGLLEPDVLVLDVHMPGGGPAVTRILRTRWPGLRIVVYSGHSSDHVRRDMLAAGADAFVLKTGRLRPLMTALAAP